MELPNPSAFLDKIFAGLEKDGIYVASFPIDHICYRVASLESYQGWKESLAERNELLTETMINGRPIATFRLANPIVYGERTIPLLELPSPKPGSVYPEGYEHVEFVVGEAPADWVTKYAQVNWDRKGLSKAVNPDVRLQIEKGISVKFHEHSLDYVIAYLD